MTVDQFTPWVQINVKISKAQKKELDRRCVNMTELIRSLINRYLEDTPSVKL